MTPFRRFLKDESGTASIEFLFVFPIVFLIFTASVESSLYMARYVMLDRGVDLVVRNLRLGTYGNLTHQQLKEKICAAGLLVASKQSCLDRMRISMQAISTANFNTNALRVNCVERADQMNIAEPPANEFQYGVSNEIMFIGVCYKEEPMFPTTQVSVKMRTLADGFVAMIVTSFFVNEPR